MNAPMATPLTDLSRLCVHTITTKAWSLDECAKQYSAAGIKGITVWRDTLKGRDVAASGRLLRDHGLSIVSLCRGGFFTGETADQRQRAIDENRRCIDEAAALGAPAIVLVCGATPGVPLIEARRQITAALAELLPHAAAAGVSLGIEPLHPMYAGDRSAINTIGQARAICHELQHPRLGIAIDVYHVWWDPDLEKEIAATGREGRLLAFHVCDWRVAMTDILNDRGLMGEGCIPLRQIRTWIEAAGFNGFNEVEIFSHRHWAADPNQFLAQIKTAYLQFC